MPGADLMWKPEFLREGFAVQDTLAPDRLVYGVAEPGTPAADAQVALLDAVYARLIAGEVPRLVMGFETAELVKVSANAFLATKISFINAIADCARPPAATSPTSPAPSAWTTASAGPSEPRGMDGCWRRAYLYAYIGIEVRPAP